MRLKGAPVQRARALCLARPAVRLGALSRHVRPPLGHDPTPEFWRSSTGPAHTKPPYRAYDPSRSAISRQNMT